MNDKVLLRTGLRWRVIVNRNNIISVEKINDSFLPGANCFKGSVMKSSINILFTFKHAVNIERLYRKPVLFDKIVMSIDQANDFMAELMS